MGCEGSKSAITTEEQTVGSRKPSAAVNILEQKGGENLNNTNNIAMHLPKCTGDSITSDCSLENVQKLRDEKLLLNHIQEMYTGKVIDENSLKVCPKSHAQNLRKTALNSLMINHKLDSESAERVENELEEDTDKLCRNTVNFTDGKGETNNDNKQFNHSSSEDEDEPKKPETTQEESKETVSDAQPPVEDQTPDTTPDGDKVTTSEDQISPQPVAVEEEVKENTETENAEPPAEVAAENENTTEITQEVQEKVEETVAETAESAPKTEEEKPQPDGDVAPETVQESEESPANDVKTADTDVPTEAPTETTTE